MTHILTENEQRIVDEAKGAETVRLTVASDQGEWEVPFCGTCGRIICHPDCPRGGSQ